MAETDALLKSEQKLYIAERSASSCKAEVLKLKLKNDEMSATSKGWLQIISSTMQRRFLLPVIAFNFPFPVADSNTVSVIQRKEKLPGFAESGESKSVEVLHELHHGAGKSAAGSGSDKTEPIKDAGGFDKVKKKSVRISVMEPHDGDEEESEYETGGCSKAGIVGKGYVANVASVDYKEATMQCPQQ